MICVCGTKLCKLKMVSYILDHPVPTIGPEKIANFHFSHYKSMETIATRVLIRLE